MTNDKSVYDKLKLIRSHGRADGNYFSSPNPPDYISLGYNYRISSMTAALGMSQLAKIRKIIEMRQKIADYYNKRLGDIHGVAILIPPKGYNHVYQIYSALFDKRDDVIKHLEKNGILSKIYFDPAHLTTFYKSSFNLKPGSLPITESISKSILSLPIFPQMTTKELDYVCDVIEDFYSKKG